jgi:hypothetical protein
LAWSRIKQLLGAVARQILGDIHGVAAAVVAPAGIALRVLVGQHRAQRSQHGPADIVLRRNQLDAAALAPVFGLDRLEDLVVLQAQLMARVGGSVPDRDSLDRGLVHQECHQECLLVFSSLRKS